MGYLLYLLLLFFIFELAYPPKYLAFNRWHFLFVMFITVDMYAVNNFLRFFSRETKS